MNAIKNQILKLREQGKNYEEIRKELKCSKSLVAYYCNSTSKEKAIKLQKNNRYAIRNRLKEEFGGKCQICGYNKCLAALEFHHKDPKEKLFNVMDALWSLKGVKKEQAYEEAKKCILICSNCHRELHDYNE